MRITLSHIIYSTLTVLTAMSTASCSMMTENRDDCPTGLYVRFTYDYNTMRADMFKDHVGHVRLYVFDEEGRLAAQRTVSNTDGNAPISRYGYTMHFTEQELPAGHSYRLQAVAMQRDWDVALDDEGAKYRFSASPTDNSESMKISLDHDSEPIAGTQQYPVSAAAPLDTLWHTLKVTPHAPVDGIVSPEIDRTAKPYSIYPQEDQLVRLEPGHATYATVSLIRDTKHLNITLRHVDEPETVFASDYEVRIVDRNAHLTHDNTVLTDDCLRYTPYASWTTRMLNDNTVEIEDVITGNPGQYHAAAKAASDADDNVKERSAHFNLMFNRIMYNAASNEDNAMLEILNKNTGELVANVNLPYILSVGRQAYEIQNYSQQEYLDREYDYHLDFFLKGGKWVEIEVHVLSWSKRVQNVEL